MTLDGKIDLVVRIEGAFLRFTIRPHHGPSTLANTKHYAFQREAVTALAKKGYEYADFLVQAAVDELKNRNRPPPDVLLC